MNYSVKISPVQRNQSSVLRFLTGYLGAGETARARELVRNGGTVKDDLSSPEANSLAKSLRDLGAVTEVLENRSSDSVNGYQVILTDAGTRPIEVIKTIREITGSGVKEAKELVDNLGVVATFNSRSKAERVRTAFMEIGAQVYIQEIDSELSGTNKSVMFAATVNGNPAEFKINLNGDVNDLERVQEVNISADADPDVKMNNLFTLSISDSDTSKLKGLVMTIKYKF